MGPVNPKNLFPCPLSEANTTLLHNRGASRAPFL